MALEVTKLKRKFSLNKNGKVVDLSDPNPTMTAEEVIKFHSGTHPELTNGVLEGPKVVGDTATYIVSTQAGKLG